MRMFNADETANLFLIHSFVLSSITTIV